MAQLLLHTDKADRRVAEGDTIYYAEALHNDTLVRRRAARTTRDVRELGQVERAWRRHGFVRIHDNYLVSPARILRIRKRADSRDWEVQLAPPVNVVLPVSRGRLAALWAAFEG